MKINLWYSQPNRQWRWTLTDDKDPMRQESGSQPFLRDAMDDVASTAVIGSTVDFVENLGGSHIELTNPNEASACGCGESIQFIDAVIG